MMRLRLISGRATRAIISRLSLMQTELDGRYLRRAAKCWDHMSVEERADRVDYLCRAIMLWQLDNQVDRLDAIEAGHEAWRVPRQFIIWCLLMGRDDLDDTQLPLPVVKRNVRPIRRYRFFAALDPHAEAAWMREAPPCVLCDQITLPM